MNDLTDKSLREAFAGLPPRLPSTRECPPPELLWAAIRCEIDVAERHDLLNHTTTCPACARTWRFATQMGAKPLAPWQVAINGLRENLGRVRTYLSQPLLSPIPTWGGHSMQLNRGALASTMAGALVLAATISIPQITPPPPHRVLTNIRGGIEAQIATEVLNDRETLRLSWSGPEDALLYDLKLMNASLESVFMIEGLEAREYRLTTHQLEQLASGEHLFWMVEATLTSGERIKSKTFISQLPY